MILCHIYQVFYSFNIRRSHTRQLHLKLLRGPLGALLAKVVEYRTLRLLISPGSRCCVLEQETSSFSLLILV